MGGRPFVDWDVVGPGVMDLIRAAQIEPWVEKSANHRS